MSVERKHSHYFRVCRYRILDFYRIAILFHVTDPTIQHILKKSLAAGKRGSKDFRRDLEDIRDSVNRRIEMLDEDGEAGALESDEPESENEWIELKEYVQPVGDNVLVDVKFSTGVIFEGRRAAYWTWHKFDSKTKIIAYRLHK